jgi:hypothetical protein
MRVEHLAEALDHEQDHSRAALRTKAVEGNTVPESVQRSEQGSSGDSLVVVDRDTGRTGLTRGPGDIEQNEHGEISAPPQRIEVDGFFRSATSGQLGACLYRCVNVHFVTLKLSSVPFESHAEPPERTTQ